MNKRVYTSANGRRINIDAIIAQNESTIAVGNMKVNARGDQLGPGGKVELTRDKVMQDHYKMNTPLAVDEPPQPRKREVKKDLVDEWVEPIQPESELPVAEASSTPQPKLRGSLADSIAKNQPTTKVPVKRSGPSRI
jgi:hypothetical protein